MSTSENVIGEFHKNLSDFGIALVSVIQMFLSVESVVTLILPDYGSEAIYASTFLLDWNAVFAVEKSFSLTLS